jgi:VIT1/CCC1 family predicted Fe2+/Mn2+ transporter
VNLAVVISLLVGTVIPAAIALVTKEVASAKLKALLTGLLAAITGGLSGYLITPPSGTREWEQIALSIGVAWITAVAGYVGWWKPAVTVNAKIAPGVGLGNAPGAHAAQ